jgi:DHA2 family multidrug resistance protein
VGQADTVESGSRKWIVAFGIALAPLLETIDSTIVNVALPDIQGNLGASLDEAAFIITGYLAANVIVIPLTPWFAERLGRRQYLTMSIAGFTIASILCGFAPSIGLLVTLRIVQGFFGGGLIATVQAALRDLFPPDEASVGQAIFGVVIACGPILGPLFGGIIVDNATWPWIFFVNVVPGVISGTIAATMLKNPAKPRKLPVDLTGIFLLSIGIATLEYVLEEGERKDWFSDERIAWLAIVSVVALVAFVIHSLHGTRRPVVDLRVLRDRNVWIGCILAGGFGITLIGINFILPQYLQSAIAFTPTLSGELLLFRGVPIVALAPAIGMALGANRFDPRLLIGFGFLATGLGTGWIGTVTTPQSDFGTLVWPLVLAGVGTAFLIIPLLTVVIAGVSNAIAPKASAFLTLSVQLGGSVSSAFVVTLLDRRESVHGDALAATMTLRHQMLVGAVDAHRLAALVSRQAAVQSFADVAYVVSALAFVLVPCVFIVRRPSPGPLTQVAE